jgi:DNA repair protein SbcC/Rad50
MKILGVKFKNLSAMSGEWEIRFDQPPLADTGLFAIVGPNGSGKTTILDALSLALYGETPRLKNPESGIITWQSNDSYAEVTFAIDNHVYRSKWSVRKVAGRPDPPEMCLADCNGKDTILEDRVIRVRDRVAELTGLDFKRFCRSILLAQGDFAAFLDALESERAEILERIIGPELTREVEDSIRSQVQVEETRLLELQEAAAAHMPPDKARIEALQESVEGSREELEEINRILEEYRAQEDWLQRVALLESEQSAAAEELGVAQADHARAEESLRRVEDALPARPLCQGVEILQGLHAEAQAAAERLQQLETSIQTHEIRTQALEVSLRECRAAMDQARHRLQERSEDIQGAWLRDRDIAAEEQRLQETLARHEALERGEADYLRQQAEIGDQMAALQVRQQEIDQWLTANSGDARMETDIPVVEEILGRLGDLRRQQETARAGKPEGVKVERRSARELRRAEKALLTTRRKTDKLTARKMKRERRLEEILAGGTLDSLAADYRNRKKQLEACRQLVKIGQEYQEQVLDEDLHAALARIQAEQERLTQSLALEQAQLTVWEETAQWRETLKKLSPEREALKPASPCPLCGALDHPFIDQGLPEFETIDSQLRDQRKKVTALRIQLSSLSASETQIRAQVGTLATIHKEWAEACAQAGGEWVISNPDAVVEDIRLRKKEIKRCKSRIRAARWHAWRFRRIGRSFHKRSDQLADREQACEQIRDRHQQTSQALADLEEELGKLRQTEDAARELLAERLEPIHEPLPPVAQEMDLLVRLQSRRQEYREHLLGRDASSSELSSLEGRRQALPQDLEHIREQLQAASEELAAARGRLAALKAEREELFGTFDPVRERHELEQQIELGNAEQVALREEMENIRRTLREQHDGLPEAQDRAQNARSAAAEAEATLREQALAVGIGSLDELRENVVWLEKEETIRERYAATETAVAEARARAETARQGLEAALAEPQQEDSLELVRWKMAEAAKHRDAVQAQWRDAETDLRDLRDAEREYLEIQRAITDRQKLCDRVRAEQQALQSQDSAAAARKLQRLMLERLLHRANSHLEMLSGRYALRPVSDEGFGLQIEDALEARDCRPAKTLSGGESFVVSLCLALGLSEMASDDRKIESLFLDEGFGTLDDEMLYRVMASLKRLRANGKMVGVISHVKRLADEITTQIRVEKQPGGSSRITVVA